MTSGPLPVAQPRGHETLERIVRAAVELVDEGGLEAASVPAITRRAGTSVGNFYRRFPGKEALLDHLEREFLAGRPAHWERVLETERWRDAEPERLLETIVEEIVHRHEEHRGLLRAIALRARADYERRVRELGVGLPDRVAALLDTHWPGWVRHPRPNRAVALGFEMVAATAGEMILFRELAEPNGLGELVAELTRAWIAYLRSA